MFSLGCVYYETLTGRRAFPGSDSRQILHQLMDEYPLLVSRLVPGLPETVDQAIYKAIAKNREDRFSSCIEFQHALNQRSATRPRSRGRLRPARSALVTSTAAPPSTGMTISSMCSGAAIMGLASTSSTVSVLSEKIAPGV